MKKINFNKEWLFSVDSKYDGGRFSPADFRKVDLPHDYMVEMPLDKSNPPGIGFFSGREGSYKKEFTVSEKDSGKKVYVEFEGVYMNAEIKLNDNVLLRHPYGYTSFICDLTPFVKFGESNLLCVRVDNTTVPNSRWYTGSGIYRNAWLFVENPTHIDYNGVYIKTEKVEGSTAFMHLEVNLSQKASGLDAVYSVCDKHGNKIVSKKEKQTNESVFKCEFAIKNAELWDVDMPNLYELKVELYDKDILLDESAVNFGIRTIYVNAEEGFVINGKSVKLKGGCVHHDNGLLGAASYKRSEERKIELMKKSGFNAVRCAHNPPSPHFLDTCDRLGMIVIDEAFDCWKMGKTQYDYHVVFDDWCERDIDSMVLRDRNHPSVCIWSIGNEIFEQSGLSGAYETSRRLYNRVRLHDDRPVTLAAMPPATDANVNWRKIDGTFAPLEIAGYNYSHYRYEADHELFPDRVIIGTETVPKDIFDTWEMTERLPYVVGDFVWTSIDYLGEPGLGRVSYEEESADKDQLMANYPWNQANCGDFDLCGFKRPQSHYRDILWGVDKGPYIFVRRPVNPEWKTEIVSYWGWNDGIAGWDFAEAAAPLTIDVYTSAESVELFLNGKSLGSKTVEKLRAEFSVQYESGELKAVDSDGNERMLKTPGKAVKIKLSADRNEIDADGDLCYITAEITDSDGGIVVSADRTLFLSVTGAGKILAVGSGNPKTEEMYIGNFRKTHDGKMMAVVKSEDVGEITLTAIADQLASDSITVKTV